MVETVVFIYALTVMLTLKIATQLLHTTLQLRMIQGIPCLAAKVQPVQKVSSGQSLNTWTQTGRHTDKVFQYTALTLLQAGMMTTGKIP